LCEKGLSLSIASGFSNLLKKIFSDSKVCQRLKLYPKKIRRVLKDVVVPAARTDLVEIMKKTTFALLIDNYTDVACVNMAGMVVKIFDDLQLKWKECLVS